jgi:hypothetical protein
MLYAGIDWADDHHDLVVIDDTGRTLGSLRVSHSPLGLTQLHEFLAKFAPEQAEMACIVETGMRPSSQTADLPFKKELLRRFPSVGGFKFDGRQIADARMQPPLVVDSFDPFFDARLRFG